MRQVSKALIVMAFALVGGRADAGETSVAKHTIAYDLTIAGVSIGDVRMFIDPWTRGDYTIDLDMSFRFLFWSGEAVAKAAGRVDGEVPRPFSYDVEFSGPSKPVVIKTAFDGQGPTEWSITPQPDEKYLLGRIAISEADLKGAIDPISALVIRADTGATACNRTLPIFTGGTRFNLVLRPGPETEPGVFACDVRYVPVSGHRKDSDSVARMVRSAPILSIIEIAPGLWAPHRVGMPTSVGTLAITHITPEPLN